MEVELWFWVPLLGAVWALWAFVVGMIARAAWRSWWQGGGSW